MIKDKPLFLPNLGVCMLVDVIGMASYLLPAAAEFLDLLWAPLSALLFYRMFGGRFGAVGAVLNFLEEIIPFTDIIPSFTIAWFIRRNELAKSTFRQKI